MGGGKKAESDDNAGVKLFGVKKRVSGRVFSQQSLAFGYNGAQRPLWLCGAET